MLHCGTDQVVSTLLEPLNAGSGWGERYEHSLSSSVAA